MRQLAVQLMREASDPLSPRAPWLGALPGLAPRGEGEAPHQLHAETLPREYLHLVGNGLQVKGRLLHCTCI